MTLAFRSDIVVEPIQIIGSDLEICRSAWVSSGIDKTDVTEDEQRGLLRSLMRQKHGSPFEEGYFSFHIEAPRAVRDEHVRHRIGHSYSSTSLRYRIKDHTVYIPPPHRPLEQADNFKRMRPVYVPYSPEKYERYYAHLARIYTAIYEGLQEMEADGFTETEAVRWVTEDGLYVAYRARVNPRSLMAFLSLRTHDPEANHVSYPMWEIEQVATKMEVSFASHFPLTYAAFNEFGREAP